MTFCFFKSHTQTNNSVCSISEPLPPTRATGVPEPTAAVFYALNGSPANRRAHPETNNNHHSHAHPKIKHSKKITTSSKNKNKSQSQSHPPAIQFWQPNSWGPVVTSSGQTEGEPEGRLHGSRRHRVVKAHVDLLRDGLQQQSPAGGERKRHACQNSTAAGRLPSAVGRSDVPDDPVSQGGSGFPRACPVFGDILEQDSVLFDAAGAPRPLCRRLVLEGGEKRSREMRR